MEAEIDRLNGMNENLVLVNSQLREDNAQLQPQPESQPEPQPEPQEAEDLGESTFVIVDEQDAVEPEEEEEVAGEVAEKPAAWFPSFFYYDADAVADTDDAA